MNKVITINLGGTAWQLEEGGYDTLRDYLETAATRLLGNPDRDEILSDIEWAIAEKFRPLLSNHKNVVLNKEVAAVLSEMGPIETEPGKAATPGPIGPDSAGSAGASGTAGAAKEEKATGAGGLPKRLYRIQEGAMVAGVSNGLAAYFNIDPTLVRLAFVFLTMAWGTGLVIYVVMAIVVPQAHTPEEKAAASGNPSTAQEFIRRAKEGYYEAMKGFPDRQARREWKRRFKSEMRAHTHQWRYNWHSYWAQHTPVSPGLGWALPVISVLEATVTVVWVCAMVSLLSSGALFGLALPANVPLWLAAVIVMLMFGLVTGPLKAVRYACYWGYGLSRPAWLPAVRLVDAVVWLTLAVVLLLLATRHLPELGAAVHALPSTAHQAANDIQNWWKAK